MIRMHVYILLVLLFLVSCNNKPKEQPQQPVEEQTDTAMSAINTADSLEPKSWVVYDGKGKKILLAVDSSHVSCYTQVGDNPPQKLKFDVADDYDGFPIIYSHRYGNTVFLVGDFVPNSNRWTSRFSMYKINADTFQMTFVDNGAAVHFGKEGFKVAKCRLTNPDADCTANEIWVMHDSCYDVNGKKVSEDKTEYDYEIMEKEYGDSLVNAQRMSV